MNYEIYVLQALDDMALCINVATRYLDEHKNAQLDEKQELSLVNKTEIYKRMETCASMLINFKHKVDECKELENVSESTEDIRESIKVE